MVKLRLDVVAVLHLLRAQQDKTSQGENQSCAEKRQCVCIHTNIHDEYYCIHTWMFPITAVDCSFHRWTACMGLSGWVRNSLFRANILTSLSQSLSSALLLRQSASLNEESHIHLLHDTHFLIWTSLPELGVFPRDKVKLLTCTKCLQGTLRNLLFPFSFPQS